MDVNVSLAYKGSYVLDSCKQLDKKGIHLKYICFSEQDRINSIKLYNFIDC
jgi:hypothetical protein